jgi:hypothetical protein
MAGIVALEGGFGPTWGASWIVDLQNAAAEMEELIFGPSIVEASYKFAGHSELAIFPDPDPG